MLSSEDLSVVDDCLRACTRTRRGDPPAIGQHLVEHPRHPPHLAQPRPNPTLDHLARLGRRIQLAHRPIVDAGEPDAVADHKVFETVRTTHDRLVTRRIQRTSQRHKRLDVSARAQSHDQNLHQNPSTLDNKNADQASRHARKPD